MQSKTAKLEKETRQNEHNSVDFASLDRHQVNDLNRRNFFANSFFAGFLSTLTQACADAEFSESSSRRNSMQSNSKPSDTNPSPLNRKDASDYTNTLEVDIQDTKSDNRTDSGENGVNDPDVTSTSDPTNEDRNDNNDDGQNNDAPVDSKDQSCAPHRIDTIDTAKIPNAAADRTPAVKFYGQDRSAMIVMKFPNGVGIQQVIVCKENGRPIAIHSMTGADNNGQRPIILDHLFLNQINNIKIIINMEDGKRFWAQVPKSYFRDLGGAITDLSMAPNSSEQSVAQFVEKYDSFRSDPNITYPNDYNNQVRNLQTVASTSAWTRGPGVKGAATDVMGEPIDLNGQALIEHPTFCTYSNRFRTMIRIG